MDRTPASRSTCRQTLPANARQIMYAARPYILVTTGCEKLNDAYFTQTLLPTFIEENPNLTETWDVVYDARGHLIEPHTDHSLPLGTLQVPYCVPIDDVPFEYCVLTCSDALL